MSTVSPNGHAGQDLLADAGELSERLVEIRRTIHAWPELAFEEVETSKLVRSTLDDIGIPHETIAKTGIVARLQGNRPGGCVALRADMDALPIHEETGLPFASKRPGLMHACGHDAHTTMLLGAAMLLAERREEIAGTVTMLFQPSEEKLPGGAPSMIREGALENPRVEAIFGQHVLPLARSGTIGVRRGFMLASADELYIDVIGRSGHAAIPQKAIDPIVAASELVGSLQTIVSRTLDPFSHGVLSITSFNGGDSTNVIPDRVRMMGTLRATDEEWRAAAHARIERTVHAVCTAAGCEYELEIRKGYPVLVTSVEEVDAVEQFAGDLLGSENVFDADPMMAAEDFAYYLQERPGAFWWIGAGQPEDGCIAGLHNSTFTIDESILPIGAATMASTALRFLAERSS